MGGGHSPDSPSPTRDRLGRVCPVGCGARLRSPFLGSGAGWAPRPPRAAGPTAPGSAQKEVLI